MEKPKMLLELRISIDEAQRQRFTENEVMKEMRNNNVEISNPNKKTSLLLRKSDGKVIGEFLIPEQKVINPCIECKHSHTKHKYDTGWFCGLTNREIEVSMDTCDKFDALFKPQY